MVLISALFARACRVNYLRTSTVLADLESRQEKCALIVRKYFRMRLIVWKICTICSAMSGHTYLSVSTVAGWKFGMKSVQLLCGK